MDRTKEDQEGCQTAEIFDVGHMFKPCIAIRNAVGRSLIFMLTCLGLSSCASVSSPALQPKINGLIVAGQSALAAEKITAQASDYGTGNYVLYHLDRALVLQLTGDFSSSVVSLEKAKLRQEELYTRSVTNEASTWVVNDNRAPYRAPEYERVLMNVFQSLNYLQMNNLNEALVEARDLDSKFPVVAGVYGQDKHRFEDNGFARLLCGILYEAAGTGDDLNDALIAYKQALTVYDSYYNGQYVPRVLKNRLIRMAERFHDPDAGEYRRRFSDVRIEDERPDTATVYLLEAVGFSPVRVAEIIPVPVDMEFVAKIAFPKFVRRLYAVRGSHFVVQGRPGPVLRVDTELGADIEELAEKDLEARKALTLSKSVIRPALKYLVERNQKDVIEKKHGRVAAELFGIFSNLYNIYSEQADLRSWQSLPAQVRVARIQVPVGTYRVSIEDVDVNGFMVASEDKGDVLLKAGQTYFFVRRSLQ